MFVREEDRFAFSGTCDETADELLSGGDSEESGGMTKVVRATIYLQELAQQCDEMPSTDVYAWMLEKGISKRTTEGAKKLVGIASVRHGNRLYFDLRPLRISSLEEA